MEKTLHFPFKNNPFHIVLILAVHQSTESEA